MRSALLVTCAWISSRLGYPRFFYNWSYRDFLQSHSHCTAEHMIRYFRRSLVSLFLPYISWAVYCFSRTDLLYELCNTVTCSILRIGWEQPDHLRPMHGLMRVLSAFITLWPGIEENFCRYLISWTFQDFGQITHVGPYASSSGMKQPREIVYCRLNICGITSPCVSMHSLFWSDQQNHTRWQNVTSALPLLSH